MVGIQGETASEQTRVAIADPGGVPIDAVPVVELEGLHPSEEVQFTEGEAAHIVAARPRESDGGAEGPGLLAGDLQVHDAVVVAHRQNPNVVDDAQGPEVSFAFVDEFLTVEVALPEKELPANHFLAGHDVEPVGETEEGVVLLRVPGIEDVDSLDPDLPDPGARGLQLVAGRHECIGACRGLHGRQEEHRGCRNAEQGRHRT